MNDIWFTSDTHFGHANLLTFEHPLGPPHRYRPFDSVEEMDEALTGNWNAYVKPSDKVYHLGDFSFGNRAREYAARLNGSKRLILGNHDRVKRQHLVECFQEILSWRVFDEQNFICTHVPIHRSNFRRVDYNVHGHMHHNSVPEHEYMCICVEQTCYRPLHMDEVIARLASAR